MPPHHNRRPRRSTPITNAESVAAAAAGHVFTVSAAAVSHVWACGWEDAGADCGDGEEEGDGGGRRWRKKGAGCETVIEHGELILPDTMQCTTCVQ